MRLPEESKTGVKLSTPLNATSTVMPQTSIPDAVPEKLVCIGAAARVVAGRRASMASRLTRSAHRNRRLDMWKPPLVVHERITGGTDIVGLLPNSAGHTKTGARQ